MTNKDNIKCLCSLAEEVAYSSKGHFKSGDFLKIFLYLILSVPIITSLLTFGFEFRRLVVQIISFIGLIFASLSLFSFNSEINISNKVKRHMELGNEYLDVYKEIRTIFYNPELIDKEKVEYIQLKVSDLDKKSNEYPIGIVARSWAKFVIQSEMDLEWIYKAKKTSTMNF